MKVRTFTKKDVAAEIANRLDATLHDSLTFTTFESEISIPNDL